MLQKIIKNYLIIHILLFRLNEYLQNNTKAKIILEQQIVMSYMMID